MPISEDEIDYNRSQEPQSTMSKAELRKTHKPIMEKRRRARINHCLNEIKTLILEAMNKDPSRHTKLEKADILEMAVKHLQNVQRQQLAMAMASDPTVLRKFKTGFNECAAEIDRYMNQSDSVDNSMKLRVVNHLQKCIGGIEQVAQFSFGNVSFVSGSSTSQIGSNTGDQNNNPRIQIPQGIQLIPSRLPSGELALLVPNSRNINFFPTNQRPSAFATVIPSSTADASKPLSPPVSPVIQDELITRSRSPQGFRPVVSTKHYNEDHQVPQITSTAAPSMEVKSLKFPINKRLDFPKKIGEPLCIITNQAERYKQAQTREDSAHFEENITRGVKRKCPESHGLLTMVNDGFFHPPAPKIVKTQLLTPDCKPSSSFCDDDGKKIKQESPISKESSDSANDMWRPW
ncbi:transcription factor HES-4-B-like [Diorhabda sublineata]|uniref:transcription factor HES-4-B-like n=1 Tax=Diorhabda sublineata TaxID=1163346 RepID=UPI0024E09E5F|nr:transcription factor HES-4-B-like [Diorhabda sublineata]